MTMHREGVTPVPHKGDLAAIVYHLLACTKGRRWRVRTGTRWHTALPPETGGLSSEHHHRRQGWQIQLSATPRSAETLVTRVVPILRDHQVPFTFAPTSEVVRWLGSRACGRVDAGKVLTAYPRDDLGFIRLARELSAATRGLAGPRILSARQSQPGSVVHYGYGSFDGDRDGFDTLDNDGLARKLLVAPDGTTVYERREPWFTPAPWAPAPPADDERAAAVPPSYDRAAVRLHDRYVVRQALAHGATGGTYLAREERAGTTPGPDVVIKHARAHTDTDPDGADARTRLLDEAHLLRLMDQRLPTPRPFGVFAQAGDLFLVEERLAGQSLRHWVGHQTGAGAGVPLEPALAMARRLRDLIARAHQAGLVLRGLDPASILVTADGYPVLTGLRAAAPIGQPGRRPHPSSYTAPELHAGQLPIAAATAEDAYTLGALMFLLATGNDPVLPDDDPLDARPARERLAAWLAIVARYGDSARALGPAIMTLLADHPRERGDLALVERLLAAEEPRPAGLAAGQPTGEELLADGLEHLMATMRPDDERLWRPGTYGARTDSRNVQHGAAGVLAVLLRAHASGEPSDVPWGAVDAAARKAAGWLSDRCERGDRVLPGLHFGRAGVAWVLADAAVALGEPHLLEQAERLALALPTSWPNPDIAHGLAGAALTHLHVGQLAGHRGDAEDRGDARRRDARRGDAGRRGDGPYLERAAEYAAALRAAAVPGANGPTWPIPATFDSQLAGATHYGFAHGVAGIGYALLALGTALGEQAYVDLASEAGYTLCRAARTDDGGAAWWPVGPADATRLPHWCSGSSGVGTFLLRLFAVTGEQRFGEYARAAAGAVHRARWQSSPAVCHGLAGDGEFLLDAAEILADPTYRAWAEDLVPLIAVRHCRMGGRALIPDETLRSVVADYNVGLSGVLAYLMRLRYGGARLFLVDDLFIEEAQAEPRTLPADWRPDPHVRGVG
ncbi:class IV lanthionine synthetase LanL [Actinopolymorpha alba]|uniref:class IV lanthionine synthetase LanL n=1 Tax=Actinopolymorpha alba TaxID=533267 RepID=UPI000360D1AD|nr:class IV lanthionine synthetase LanL [Actinopolymorpha alba]